MFLMGGGSSLAANQDPRVQAFVEEYAATPALPSRALQMDVSLTASCLGCLTWRRFSGGTVWPVHVLAS